MKKINVLLLFSLCTLILFVSICTGGVFAEAEKGDDNFYDFLKSSYPVEDTRNLGSYVVSYIYTPGGTRVYAREYEEMSDDELDDFLCQENLSLENDPNFSTYRRIGNPTNRFNCYSYALHLRDYESNTHFLASNPDEAARAEYESLYDTDHMLYKFWNDSHFIKVKLSESDGEVRVGDIILYFKNKTYGQICHAGCVSQVDSNGQVTRIISKLGCGGLFEHSPKFVPREYSYDGPEGSDMSIYYEFYRFYINHNYIGSDGVNLGSSGHRVTCQCTGCDKTEVKSHKMSSWTNYTVQKHRKTCSGCDRVLTGNHNYIGWTSYSDSKHRGHCEQCSRMALESHSFTSWSSNDNTTHSRSCKCGRVEQKNHSFSGWVNAGFNGHKKTCGDCGKSITQAHIYGTGSVCTICGYSGTGVAPIIVPGKAGLTFGDRSIAD